MAKRPKVDTEPDDAFAAVLGDIDGSPLMRTPDVPPSPASQTGEKKAGTPRPKPKKTKDQPHKKNRPPQPPAHPEEDTVPEEAQEKAPNKVPDQTPVQAPAQVSVQAPGETIQEDLTNEAGQEPEATGTGWTTRRESGCVVVEMVGDMEDEAKAEAPAQLRALLLELLDKDTPCVRIDLSATTHLDASSLAVLLSFASLLEQRKGCERLEIAARDGLAQFLCLCKVEETHPITLIGE
jgi:hypothetical protein